MEPTIVTTAADVVRSEGQNGHREGCKGAERRGDPRAVRSAVAGQIAGDPGAEQAWTLKAAARDYIWLYDLRHGVAVREIAVRSGVTIRQVREGIERARALETDRSKDHPTEELSPGRAGDLGFRLIPLFPIGAFTPQTPCPHHRAIKRGSTLCCMVCHASGMDDHPGFRRDPGTDPAPEPQTAPASEDPAPDKAVAVRETRKQRRRRLYAESCALA